MIHLNIDSAYKSLRLDQLLKKAAETALTLAGEGASELSLVLAGDKKIKSLNKEFRGINQATDVLSFPSDNSAEGPRYLGDIIISVARAKEQAEESGHMLSDELVLLTVHGVLHLLGHDHGAPSTKAKMWAVQNDILRILGVSIDVDQAVASYSKS
jgi:probable rRNA maturation factor